jgi:hypothetical protein
MTNRGVDMAVIKSEKWRMTHVDIPAGPFWSGRFYRYRQGENPTGYNPVIVTILIEEDRIKMLLQRSIAQMRNDHNRILLSSNIWEMQIMYSMLLLVSDNNKHKNISVFVFVFFLFVFLLFFFAIRNML